MPRPQVTSEVVDLTTRVSSTGTYNAAIVIDAKKGPINKPVLVTSQTELLRRFTPDEVIELGWDEAYLAADFYLSEQSNLYVVRCAHTNDLANDDSDSITKFGGCKIVLYKSKLDNTKLEKGFNVVVEDQFPIELDVDEAEEVAMVIYGANQGAWNNKISVEIITDPDIVNLDGAFIINVYKDDRTSGTPVLVEQHTCSLDPKFKDGYGNNCFVETVLTASNYIRASVNDIADFTDVSYKANVIGTVEFTNETIKQTAVWRQNREYAAGDIIKVADKLENVTAYYKCTLAGRAGDTGAEPTWVVNDEFVEEIVDNKCKWELAELVKTYAKLKQFNKGDIITVTSGAKTLSYRALNKGYTGGEDIPWVVDGKALDRVEDGEIVWTNQEQTVEAFICIWTYNEDGSVKTAGAYTYKQGIKDETIDLSDYKVYGDAYLAKELEMPKKLSVQDPTTSETSVKEKEVTYSAKLTGDVTVEHYVLPKTGKVYLAGGEDGTAATEGDRINALNTLKAKDINVQLIIDNGCNTPTYQRAIDNVCNARKQSAHGIISIPYSYDGKILNGDAAANVNYRKNILNASSYNLELFTPYQVIYDRFNDRNVYIAPSVFAAARAMDVARTSGWHWASAGYNRGVVNSLDSAHVYEDTEVDTFSDAQINTIVKEASMGNVIMDELTCLNKACDLQDAHISRYINIYLRPRLEEALKQFLFEFNDETTRNLIVKMINSFMEPQKSARAVQAYRVICDETNNLPNDIQNNICNCWLFIQPTKVIKWMKQKIIIQAQGATLSDLEF